MTHKIKVRSTRLIGGTSSQRARNAAIITKAYEIRSKLVHSGQIEEDKEYTIDGSKMRSAEILSHTLEITSEIIRLFVKQRAIPDWTYFDINEQAQ